MSEHNKELIRRFFAALSSGDLLDDLLTDDVTVWTTTSGFIVPAKARYQGGVKLLQSLFPGGLAYRVVSLTAEDDRVAAEVQARGTLTSGDVYENSYVYIFRIREMRIASLAEHFNPLIVQEKINPLMIAAMARSKRQEPV
jgi:ketosteroid isomerase-like protein